MNKLVRSEDGATAVEYGLMVALLAAVIVSIVIIMGGNVLDLYDAVCTASPAFTC